MRKMLRTETVGDGALLKLSTDWGTNFMAIELCKYNLDLVYRRSIFWKSVYLKKASK